MSFAELNLLNVANAIEMKAKERKAKTVNIKQSASADPFNYTSHWSVLHGYFDLHVN